MLRRALVLFMTLTTVPLYAERLSIKNYTTEDGLPHYLVNRIVRDSHGFLWFATREGLSRFDGYRFATYRTGDGLPSDRITDIIETPDGLYWVATAGGLVRLDPRGTRAGGPEALFTTYVPPPARNTESSTAVLRDRSGRIWMGTEGGLYVLDPAAPDARLTWVDLGIPDQLDARVVTSLAEDADGDLWIGTAAGLYRRARDGNVRRFTTMDGLPDDFIHVVRTDRDGRVWVGTRRNGLCRLAIEAGTMRVARVYGKADGLDWPWVNDIFEHSDGTLWIATNGGAFRLRRGADRMELFAGERHGLLGNEIQSIAEDASGNLWLAILHVGVARIWTRGFTSFSAADGLLSRRLTMAARHDGTVAVSSNGAGDWQLFTVTDNRVERLPMSAAGMPSWGWHQQFLEDHLGDWWFATRDGVVRTTREHARTTITTRDGLTTDVVLRLFEDSRGDIWIATVGEGRRPNGVSRWDRRTNRLQHYRDEGLPSPEHFYACAFAEDRSGAVWIGFSADGGLARYRNGTFQHFSSDDGLPPGRVHNLLVDQAGQLWIATTRGGVARVDVPDADVPLFRRYTTADGLSSNDATTLVDDRFGRVYVTTAQGVDRIEPATGRIRQYGLRDGIPLGGMSGALRDRDGTLWFLSTVLVRLIPEPDAPPRPPTVAITRLDIAGRAAHLSALGTVAVPALSVDADPGPIDVEFLALGFEPGERLLYSYRLEGAESTWSAPSDRRRVTYAGLGAGTYRFAVRAVNVDGLLSETPATFVVTVRPPLWQRWWFMALVLASVAAAGAAAHRYRVARLLQLEQMRTRIATDLHDDIGANLTRIAVLSELARRQARNDSARADGSLASIATVARESVASLGDIVWAIRPDRDRVDDLVRRMRTHVEEVFAAGDVVATVDARSAHDVAIPADIRRDVFLVFKEAVTNAARHAACTHVQVTLGVDAGRLVLVVTDDGSGFETDASRAGNGIANMRRRAARLGGDITITSSRTGTTLRLVVPYSSR